jgi:hypothetical protein
MSEEKPRTRICWTEQEIEQVAEHAFLLSLENTENLWDLVRRSQEALPKDRQRNITGRNYINEEMLEKFNEIRKRFFEDLALAYSVEIEIEREILVEKPKEELIGEISTEELIIELARRVTPLLAALPQVAEKAIKDSSPSNEEKPKVQVPASTPKKRLQKILVLEFLPGQEEIILNRVKELGIEVELVFGGKGRREDIPRSCNWSIINTKVSHSFLAKMQKQIHRERVFMVNGINAAIQKIQEISKKS